MVICLVCASCAKSHEPGYVRACPPLVVDSDLGPVSYGRIAGRSTELVPTSCVSVYVHGERVATSHVTYDHTFAIRFAALGDLRDESVELRIERLADDDHEHSYPVVLRTPLQARIGYPPDTTPLMLMEDITFTGWLTSEAGHTFIPEAWLVNWSSGDVTVIDPPPESGATFVAHVGGRGGDCVSPVSGYAGGPAGGCWWPRGGGGCVSLCSEQQIRMGACVGGGTCAQPRGCAILDVDEHRSGAPPPELDNAIPVGRRDAGPDAGSDDAGSDDAGSDDAGSDDAGSDDAGSDDAGSDDAGPEDGGSPDAGDGGLR